MSYPWRNFRDWLDDEENVGNLLRIKTPINCGNPNSIVDAVPRKVREENFRVYNNPGASGKQFKTEVKALARYLHTLPNKPIGFIERPRYNLPSVPLVINPWCTRERVWRMANCTDKESFIDVFKNMSTRLISPVVVNKNQAPVKEIIIKEKDIDLYQNAPRVWVEFENQPWSPCGGGQWIIQDAESGNHDLGMWRAGFYEWKNGDPKNPWSEDRRKKYMYVTLVFLDRYGPAQVTGEVASKGGAYYRDNYRKFNKPMPAAYAMCPDPGVTLASVAKLSVNWPLIDDYDVAGGIRGAPVEVVEAETIPGLMVPANAEYVFEGEILPEDYIVPPNSEGIIEGYMIGGEACPVFRIKCITHRKNPIWCTTWSSKGIDQEGVHSSLVKMLVEAEMSNYLRGLGFNIKDIVYSTDFVVIQTGIDGAEKPPNYGKQILTVAGVQGGIGKYTIVVGPDVNPYNLEDVWFAVGQRAQPITDSIMNQAELASQGIWEYPPGVRVIHPLYPGGESICIDALIKVPERMSSHCTRTDPLSWELEMIAKMEKKLGGTNK